MYNGWLFQKKPKQGGWEHGISRVIEKEHMEIPRINYKEWCGISRDVQEKLMEFLALLHFS